MNENINILVGCEESQAVTIEFRKLGFNAFSCDTQECSGGYPEWHIQEDIFNVLNPLKFYTQNRRENFVNKWHLIILHPPCTKIAVSGNRWYGSNKEKFNERLESIDWTVSLWNEAIKNCESVGLENPVGVLNKYTLMPKPQYIQPWMFGHGETKKTGLWLHNLPYLIPAEIVEGREQKIFKMAPSPERGKLRSKTYPGIAKAIAEQWGNYITKNILIYLLSFIPMLAFSQTTITNQQTDIIYKALIEGQEYKNRSEQCYKVSTELNRKIQTLNDSLQSVTTQMYKLDEQIYDLYAEKEQLIEKKPKTFWQWLTDYRTLGLIGIGSLILITK